MKVFFDVARLLPDLPRGEDACAERLAGSLRQREGVQRVHLTEEGSVRSLCVHYTKPEMSRAHIIELVRTLAAQLAQSIGHARWDLGDSVSAARLREAVQLLEDQQGVLKAYADAAADPATNAACYLCAEYLRDRTGLPALQEALGSVGIQALTLAADAPDYAAPATDANEAASRGLLQRRSLTTTEITRDVRSGLLSVHVAGPPGPEDLEALTLALEEQVSQDRCSGLLFHLTDFRARTAGTHALQERLFKIITVDVMCDYPAPPIAFVAPRSWARWVRSVLEPSVSSAVSYFDGTHVLAARSWLANA